MSKRKIEQRFKDNSASLGDFGGLVYSQTAKPVSDLAFGRRGKTFSKVGCGAAAAYNTLRLLGREITLAEVIRDFELLRLPRFGGLWGTKPLGLRRFFRLHKVPYRLFFNCDKFKNELLGCHIAVVCSFNDKILSGMHFYCLRPNPLDNSLRAVNYTYSGGETVFPISRLRNDRFVVGYIIE